MAKIKKLTKGFEKKPAHSLEGIIGSVLIGFIILFLLAKVPLTGFAISDSIPANFGTGLFLLSGTLFAVVIYFTLRRFVRKD